MTSGGSTKLKVAKLFQKKFLTSMLYIYIYLIISYGMKVFIQLEYLVEKRITVFYKLLEKICFRKLMS